MSPFAQPPPPPPSLITPDVLLLEGVTSEHQGGSAGPFVESTRVDFSTTFSQPPSVKKHPRYHHTPFSPPSYPTPRTHPHPAS